MSAAAIEQSIPMLLGVGNAIDGRVHLSSVDDAPVTGIVGCDCDVSTIPVSTMSSAFKTPMVSPTASSASLSDKFQHPYFLRGVPPDSLVSKGLARVVASVG